MVREVAAGVLAQISFTGPTTLEADGTTVFTLEARLLDEFDIPAERFAMIGNSLRSDIVPVLKLGGWGVHVPYHLTWAHENEAEDMAGHPRLRQVSSAAELPQALREVVASAAPAALVV